MDNFHSHLDVENLTKELCQGREMTMRLRNLLNVESSSSSSSSNENCNYLLHKILRSYDESLSMLKLNRPAVGQQAPTTMLLAANNTNQDSPHSLVSDDSDQEFKDQASRKRKAVTKWTQKVTVCPESGVEGQLEDGYNWRKYGQKDILGAKHPRGYYRCSHRHGQGCLATKQVQRSDEDPTIFEITYRRKHTCNAHAYLNKNNDDNNNQVRDYQIQDPNPLPPNTQQQQQPNFNTQTSLRVITQDLNPSTFNPFDFSISSPNFNNPENNNIFSDCDDILGDYSPNKLVNVTSESFDYFTGNYGGFHQNLDTLLESELNPVVASVTSTMTSTHDTRFQPGSSEFGLNFIFENSSYYH